jgi:hypothetical protein
VRFPLVGVIVAVLTNQWSTFRSDKRLLRRATWATWLWVAMFAARLAVQVPLYFDSEVALLGSAKLAMGFPVFALVLWLSWLMMRPALHPPSAGAPPK